ncbi:response regulator transcription factor [Streptomyces xanthochromogenes]|uniref:response regulator transcription factor n=1 Tax=Streptomyces xanthochromogenes TaxID=67384 RepID=UPI003423D1AC
MIVDDQALIRSGLKTILDSWDDITVVCSASDGAEAVSAAREHRPDVVIMDLHMPRIGGLEATIQLMRLNDPPRILVLTTFDADDTIIDALEAGASGFLLKDVGTAELLASVRGVAAGGTAMSREIKDRLVRRASRRLPTGHTGLQGKIQSMTESERDVLALIGSGLTNQQISEQLHLSLASVKTYVSRMLARLQLENRTQAAILAYESGMVQDAPR